MKKVKFLKPIKLRLLVVVFITLVIGFLGGLGYSQYSASQKKFPTKGTVVKVTDGDTVKLDSGKTFRLYGISCPDKNQPYFQEAKQSTEEMALNKKVNLEYQPNYESDKFGRLSGYLLLQYII